MKIKPLILFFLFFTCWPVYTFSSPKNDIKQIDIKDNSKEYKQTNVPQYLQQKDSRAVNQFYGPVAENEGLWDIAVKVRSDSNISGDINNSTAQVATALYLKNPSAFLKKNMNSLQAGIKLAIPTLEEMSRINKNDALTMLQLHWLSWQSDNQDVETEIEKAWANNETNDNLLPNAISKLDVGVSKHQLAVSLSQSSDDLNQSEHKEVVKAVIMDSQKIITETGSLENLAPAKVIINQSEPARNPITPQTADEIPYLPLALEATASGGHQHALNTPVNNAVNDSESNSVIIDYLHSFEFEVIISQLSSVFFTALNALKSPFENGEASFTGNLLSLLKQLFSSPMFLMFLMGAVILIYMLMKVSRQKNEIHLLQSRLEKLNRENADNNILNNFNYERQDADRKDYISGYGVEKKALETVEAETVLQQNTVHDDIVLNQVNIKKFLNNDSKLAAESRPEHISKNKSSKHKKLLEHAFESSFDDGIGFIHADDDQNQIAQHMPDSSSDNLNLLDSVEELRIVNQQIRDSKFMAFWNITDQDNLLNYSELLKSEFTAVQNNEKTDVFIEEFEQIMATLNDQTPAIGKEPSDIEHLVQFKLSVHFIKVLSEMMQASFLNKFSTTVIDFLEDIIDGNNHLTGEVTKRLSVVVNLYAQYIARVKEKQF
jgi:FimV-like protein